MGADLNGCIHGLGPVTACTLCNGREEAERASRDRVVARWAAKFDGECAICDGAIWVGEVIQRTADGRYVCGEH